MEKLGVFDQLFYKADQYHVMSMIMGGASILEPVDPRKPLDANEFASHLAARLEKIPLLHCALVQDPLRLGRVRKVEDPQFDIWDHIFVRSIASPGGYTELAQSLAEFSAEPLKLTQLWNWTVLDGLEGGRLAVACKLHHSLADGIGAVEALSSMYDEEPVPPEVPTAEEASAVRGPAAFALLGQAVAETAERFWVKTPLFLFKNTGPVLSALGSGVGKLASSEDRSSILSDLPEVCSTSLNTVEDSGQRSIAYKTLSLPALKKLVRQFEATVNDAGLLLYSYAMEHYFRSIGEQIDFDLWCGVPISTRSADSGVGGNQVTAGRLSLHNTVDDVVERLRAISRDAQEAKNLARPEKPLLEIEEVMGLISPLAMDGLLYLAGKFNLLGKLGGRFAVFNALLSNVPGPPCPVYIANAVMVESIPMIPRVDLLAVSGGITSVDQTITIGFHCDGKAVRDPELFVEGVELGLEKLQRAARPAKRRRSRA